MASKAPGKAYRKGISLMEFMEEIVPSEQVAQEWFEKLIWPNGRRCSHCHSTDTKTNDGNSESQPYHCRTCKKHFSPRIGTILERSRISYRKWAIAIYLFTTSLKGVSSMKLHRDIKVTQKTAWFMLQRLRTAFEQSSSMFEGVVEGDEMYISGKDRNKHEKDIDDGRGTKGKKTGCRCQEP